MLQGERRVAAENIALQKAMIKFRVAWFSQEITGGAGGGTMCRRRLLLLPQLERGHQMCQYLSASSKRSCLIGTWGHYTIAGTSSIPAWCFYSPKAWYHPHPSLLSVKKSLQVWYYRAAWVFCLVLTSLSPTCEESDHQINIFQKIKMPSFFHHFFFIIIFLSWILQEHMKGR